MVWILCWECGRCPGRWDLCAALDARARWRYVLRLAPLCREVSALKTGSTLPRQ